MNAIFCGTPQFAVPSLERLLARGFNVQLVLTNPDEPSGRGHERKPPPVKLAAKKAGPKVFQPARLKDADTQAVLSEIKPDVIVVVAYGHLIPPWMTALPRFGCVNVHASLLPKYRGAAPVQWAIVQGESVTGVTTMKIDAGLDTGDILLQREVRIRDDDTTESLSERLSATGAELLVETLQGIERGSIVPRPQDSRLATLAPLLKKSDGRIDWSLRAEAIGRRVRGLQPWPGAYTSFRGKNLHLWSAKPAPGPAPAGLEAGALLAERETLSVVCGEGTSLEVMEVQREGRKRLSAREFQNGIRLQPGEKLE